MKKAIYVLISLFFCVLTAACSENNDTDISTSESYVISTETLSADSSSFEVSNKSSEDSTEINNEISLIKDESSSLPNGITQNTNGSLKYKNSFLSMSVSFPADFCIVDKDYTPINGIYLRNTDGTATLQLESVEDNDINAADLAEFLKEQYENAIVYITDTKDVICKTSIKDRTGNIVMSYLKIRTKRGGYNEAILYFHESDKDIFENIFNQIIFN